MLKSISIQQKRLQYFKILEFKKRIFQLLLQITTAGRVVEWLKKYHAAIYFKNHSFKYRKVCLITGRYRAVNRLTQMSRMSIRHFINTGRYPGFKKLSW